VSEGFASLTIWQVRICKIPYLDIVPYLWQHFRSDRFGGIGLDELVLEFLELLPLLAKHSLGGVNLLPEHGALTLQLINGQITFILLLRSKHSFINMMK